MLQEMMNTALGLVFPPECEICHASLSFSSLSGLCEPCRLEIKWIDAPHCVSCGRTVKNGGEKCGLCFREKYHFDRAYACAFYEKNLKELLHIYKFSGRKHLKHFFIEMLADFAQKHMNIAGFRSVAAVPMDRSKKNERGFNQSEQLARGLAEKFSLPHDSGKIIRIKPSLTQHFLTKPERRSNVLGAFFVTQKDVFAGKNVLLVDDILTSGQTASECAKVLKNAGASSVTLLVCARGL